MPTYVAKVQLYDGSRLVEAGQEFDFITAEGINPPPSEVAIAKTKANAEAISDLKAALAE